MNDTTALPPGGRSSYELTPGKLNRIETNTPARFEIVTQAGTIIAGTLVPNAPIEITPHGDIVSVHLNLLPRPDLQKVETE